MTTLGRFSVLAAISCLLATPSCGDDNPDFHTDGGTDTDTDSDTDSDTDTDTDADTTCVPTEPDEDACDPAYECCGFPDPTGEVGMGVGMNSCSGQWFNGDTTYDISCENLGSSGAMCTCTAEW